MGKTAKIVIAASLALMIASWGVVYFLFFTPGGAEFFLKRASLAYLPSEVSWAETDGDLAGGITLKNVEFFDIEGLPVPNVLRIQNLAFRADGWSPDRVMAYAQNARLTLPGSEPVVFTLNFRDGQLMGNVYTRVLVADDVSWLPIELPSRLSAEMKRLDIDFEGDRSEMRFKGSFDVVHLERDDVVFQNSSCSFSLSLRNPDEKEAELYGDAVCRGGTLSGKRTALVNLNEGMLFFEGDPLNPRIDIRGTSRVERVRIDISVKGTFSQPDLYLISGAGLSQDHLLMMLATNQSWAGTEKGLSDQSLSAGVVKDFLDYFLSGYTNNGGRMSWFLEWIRGVSVDYDQETGQVGIRAGITDRFEAGYRLKQQRSADQAGVYKLTGEYQITDRFSIYGEKEMRDEISESGDAFYHSTVPDDRIFFKIRKRF